MGEIWTARASRALLVPPQLLALRQQSHGMHQVLQGDNAYQPLILDYGNDAEIA
jgi:hypothetical protein